MNVFSDIKSKEYEPGDSRRGGDRSGGRRRLAGTMHKITIKTTDGVQRCRCISGIISTMER